jgi:hypothetical protein
MPLMTHLSLLNDRSFLLECVNSCPDFFLLFTVLDHLLLYLIIDPLGLCNLGCIRLILGPVIISNVLASHPKLKTPT